MTSKSFSTIPLAGLVSGNYKFYGAILGSVVHACMHASICHLSVFHARPLVSSHPVSSQTPPLIARAYIQIRLGPNGKIYCVPKKADHIGVIDPSLPRNIAFSVIDVQHVTTEDHKYAGAVLGTDNNIYFAPMRAPGVGMLNPYNATFSSLYIDDKFNGATNNKYVGASLGTNGMIYFVPADLDSIGVFDPEITGPDCVIYVLICIVCVLTCVLICGLICVLMCPYMCPDMCPYMCV